LAWLVTPAGLIEFNGSATYDNEARVSMLLVIEGWARSPAVPVSADGRFECSLSAETLLLGEHSCVVHAVDALGRLSAPDSHNTSIWAPTAPPMPTVRSSTLSFAADKCQTTLSEPILNDPHLTTFSTPQLSPDG
jgi:hypothetical protein